MQPHSKFHMKFIFFSLALAWGSSFYLIKISLDSFSPIQITFLRSLIGFITLAIWCKARGILIPKPSKLWFHLGVLSFLLNSAPSFLFAIAETQVSSTLAGLINAMTPAMTIFLVSVILRSERISNFQLLGLLLSFTGVSILVEVWKGLGSYSLSAVLSLFGAVGCFAVSYPYIRTFLVTREEPIEGMISIQLALSSVSFFPFYLASSPFEINLTFNSLLAVFSLGVFASGIAYVWNAEVVAFYGSAKASSVSYLIPVVALLSGYLFLNEIPTASQLIGGAIILIGIWISEKRQQTV